MTNHVSTFSPCVPFWMRRSEFWPGVWSHRRSLDRVKMPFQCAILWR
jgi:hypothetical protein